MVVAVVAADGGDGCSRTELAEELERWRGSSEWGSGTGVSGHLRGVARRGWGSVDARHTPVYPPGRGGRRHGSPWWAAPPARLPVGYSSRPQVSAGKPGEFLSPFSILFLFSNLKFVFDLVLKTKSIL